SSSIQRSSRCETRAIHVTPRRCSRPDPSDFRRSEGKVRTRKTLAAFAVAVTSVALAAGCSSGGGGSSSSSSGGVDASKATSLAAFGGMNGLIKAAKAEGELNVITLPANWANYGNIMKAFTAKYGIK